VVEIVIDADVVIVIDAGDGPILADSNDRFGVTVRDRMITLECPTSARSATDKTVHRGTTIGGLQ
jgi:hypothetical protein